METDMQCYFIISFIGINLKTDPEPPVTFILLCKIDGSYGIGKCKKKFIWVIFSDDPLLNQIELMGKHFLQSGFGHISTVFLDPVYGIAKILSVGRHGFCDRCGGTTDPKKITHGFLARANFSKAAVNVLV